ncbi:MAG: LuxR C-terminal-related transcriptional regulator [Marmoricola sp.]
MNRGQPARIVLVEDHSLFAESLEIALRMEGYDAHRLVLDDSVTMGARLLAAVLGLKPTVVLLDLDLGVLGNGAELIVPLTEARVTVAVVTGNLDRARWGECIARGARTVVSKTAPLAEILGTIRRMADGLAMMSRAERDELVAVWQQRVREEKELRSRLGHLTRREAEVLGELMTGKQVSDIARERFVSESTVRTQVKAVLAKLQVSSQLTAVGLAHRANWHPPSAAEERLPQRHVEPRFDAQVRRGHGR